MNLAIRWTHEAERTFGQIIEYLEEKWSEKQVQKFIKRVNRVLKQISEFPFIFKASIANNNVRKGFVARQCSLFYEIGQDEIVLLFFWDNRRRPVLPSN